MNKLNISRIFCHLHTPVGRKCPNNYYSPNHPEWSDPEEEDNMDGEKQKKRECEEKECKGKKQNELKPKTITDSHFPPSLQYTPSSNGDTLAPAPTNTLVPAPEKQEDKAKPVGGNAPPLI